MDNLAPQSPGVDVSFVHRFIRIDRELLMIFAALDHRLHEFVVDFYRDIGSGNLSGFDLGVDKVFRIGMFDR